MSSFVDCRFKTYDENVVNFMDTLEDAIEKASESINEDDPFSAGFADGLTKAQDLFMSQFGVVEY